MLQKKIKLSFDPSDDYRLIGITTPMPDYNLVYHLNKKLSWNLVRLGVFRLNNPDRTANYFVYYHQPDAFKEYFLTGNARPSQWMAEPNLLIVKGAERMDAYNQLKYNCSTLEGVLHTADLSSIIQPEISSFSARKKKVSALVVNVLYDLEVFMLEYSRGLKQKKCFPSENNNSLIQNPKKVYTL